LYSRLARSAPPFISAMVFSLMAAGSSLNRSYVFICLLAVATEKSKFSLTKSFQKMPWSRPILISKSASPMQKDISAPLAIALQNKAFILFISLKFSLVNSPVGSGVLAGAILFSSGSHSPPGAAAVAVAGAL
jgi:hypothetical protein